MAEPAARPCVAQYGALSVPITMRINEGSRSPALAQDKAGFSSRCRERKPRRVRGLQGGVMKHALEEGNLGQSHIQPREPRNQKRIETRGYKPLAVGAMLQRTHPKKPPRSWRAIIIRSKGEYLGSVEAPNRERAEAVAIKQFALDDDHRSRLLIRERP